MNITASINGHPVTETNNKQKINELAKSMVMGVINGELTEQECPVTHRFSDGCYLREILMPKGTLIVGKVHGTQHFNIIISGKCLSIYNEWPGGL